MTPAADQSHDAIVLEGMSFYGYHGNNPEEQALGQRFSVDVRAYVELSTAGQSDSIQDTVNYSEVYRVVKSVLEDSKFTLLEAVAHTLASRLLTAFPLTAIHIRVTKPSPPIQGNVTGTVGVEIFRRKGEATL